MEKNEEIYRAIYNNLKAGSDNLCTAASKVNDRFMLRDITGQLREYADLTRKCEEKMRQNNLSPQKIPASQKIRSKAAFAVNTLLDDSSSHIAELIVRGTRSGANALERKLTKCGRESSEEARVLCQKVIEFEREAAGTMLDYTE